MILALIEIILDQLIDRTMKYQFHRSDTKQIYAILASENMNQKLESKSADINLSWILIGMYA